MYFRHSNCALAAILFAGATIAPLPAADLPPISPLPSQNVLMSQIVRAADLNPLAGSPVLGVLGTPAGSDPLGDGEVAVRKDRRVTFQVRAAAEGATYAAMYCRFSFPFNPGCTSLGQFSTDSDGDANATLTFPAATGFDSWTGQFVLMRNNAAQFVSGFAFPPTAPQATTGVALTVTGDVQSVIAGNRALTLTGLPLSIFTDNFTRFEGGGIDSLSDLEPGFEVQVTGFTRTDGTIYATRIHLVGKSKGKDKD